MEILCKYTNFIFYKRQKYDLFSVFTKKRGKKQAFSSKSRGETLVFNISGYLYVSMSPFPEG